ncbi:MAG TPA: hypothetical protein VND93_20345 [Myxococcales bacterium]|jgi:hypothetical protein|nr:hypothetical protein [Myxococcales bacterium]
MSLRVSSPSLQTVAPSEQPQAAKPATPMDSAMADLDQAISGLSPQFAGSGGGGSDSFASSLTGARTGPPISSASVAPTTNTSSTHTTLPDAVRADRAMGIGGEGGGKNSGVGGDFFGESSPSGSGSLLGADDLMDLSAPPSSSTGTNSVSEGSTAEVLNNPLYQSSGSEGTNPLFAQQAAPEPSLDEAMKALDANILSQSGLPTDSFNGQAAPAGVQPSTSTLTNVGTENSDLFLAATGGGGGASAAPAPASASGPVSAPILDLKGGGGMSGGVVGSSSFLATAGGGGKPGGVVGGL